jgi:hypothetical protein
VSLPNTTFVIATVFNIAMMGIVLTGPRPSMIGKSQAVVEVRFKGTNKGAFSGTPATNKPIDLRIAYRPAVVS